MERIVRAFTAMPTSPGPGMLLHDDRDYSIHRDGCYLCAALKRPHQVLRTCPVNGGLREDLTHICNHQGCEGAAHAGRHKLICGTDLDGHHQHACREAAIPGCTTALMSTAANMQCAVLTTASHEDLRVRVAATAGVRGFAAKWS